jgi:formate dehydrogenase subunit delta
MSPEKLVYMANQIGKFFAHEGPEKGATSVAEHIRSFWDPRMRAAIFAHLDDEETKGLDPIPRQALLQLRAKTGVVA